LTIHLRAPCLREFAFLAINIGSDIWPVWEATYGASPTLSKPQEFGGTELTLDKTGEA
jgi:hypothetical protein